MPLSPRPWHYNETARTITDILLAVGKKQYKKSDSAKQTTFLDLKKRRILFQTGFVRENIQIIALSTLLKTPPKPTLVVCATIFWLSLVANKMFVDDTDTLTKRTHFRQKRHNALSTLSQTTLKPTSALFATTLVALLSR